MYPADVRAGKPPVWRPDSQSRMGPDLDHDSRSDRPRQSIREAIGEIQQFLTGHPGPGEDNDVGYGIREAFLRQAGAMLGGVAGSTG